MSDPHLVSSHIISIFNSRMMNDRRIRLIIDQAKLKRVELLRFTLSVLNYQSLHATIKNACFFWKNNDYFMVRAFPIFLNPHQDFIVAQFSIVEAYISASAHEFLQKSGNISDRPKTWGHGYPLPLFRIIDPSPFQMQLLEIPVDVICCTRKKLLICLKHVIKSQRKAWRQNPLFFLS